MITLEDKKLIDIWRKEQVVNHKGEWCDIDTLLDPWKSAKSQYLYKLLGEKTQIRKPISYSLSSDTIKYKLYKMLQASTFFSNYQKWYKTYYHPSNPASPDALGWELVTESEKDFVDLCYIISAENLLTNTCEAIIRKPIVVKKPDGHKFKIFPESKLMRILAKIADAFNIEGFEKFRIAHSDIVAKTAIAATLTLSIHPLDFMTMSNNANDWSSCMRWDYTDPGDYCQGTVEMMNSPCVIEAYIESSSNSLTLGSNFKWNSKRWRELFIVTPQVIAAIKGYPDWDRIFEKEVLNWLKELAETNLGWKYLDSLTSWSNDDTKGINFETRYMYNDFCYTHYLYLSPDWKPGKINYSGTPECMVCGSTPDYPNFSIWEPDLSCAQCYPTQYCVCCGERIHGDEYAIVREEIYCSYCAEEAIECQSCGELLFPEDLTPVELYNEETDSYLDIIYLCDHCLDRYFINSSYTTSNLTSEGEEFFL